MNCHLTQIKIPDLCSKKATKIEKQQTCKVKKKKTQKEMLKRKKNRALEN